MEILDRFDTKIQTLRSWVQSHPSSWIIEHQFTPATPLSESELQQIEQEYEIALPPEYRAFLQRFGDVDFGPGNQFYRVREGLSAASRHRFPLDEPFYGCELPAFQNEQYSELLKQWNAIPKDNGVLSICDYGCAIYANLILSGRFRDRIWLLSGDAAYYGPFGNAELFHDETLREPTHPPRNYSFFEWYEHWLDNQLERTQIARNGTITT